MEQTLRSSPFAFPVTHRRQRRTQWIRPTFATSTATTTWTRSRKYRWTVPVLRPVSTSQRVRKIAGMANLSFDCSARVRVLGLGYSFVQVREQSIGMDLRLWVMATPVDGTFIDLTLVSQVREIRNPKRLFAGLGFLPTNMRAPIMNKFISSQQREDVLQDVVIWSRKQYKSRPRLCRSDGKIMPFRAYCAQFYMDPND